MDFASRIDALERQNRFFKRLFMLIGIAALAVVAMGQTTSRRLEIEELELVDSKGNVRVHLFADEGSAGLRFFRPGVERPILAIGATDSGAAVSLSNSAGIPEILLDNAIGYPALSFLEGSKTRLRLSNTKGGPLLDLNDTAGKKRMRLVAGNDGTTAISLFDSRENSRVLIGHQDIDGPNIGILRSNGSIQWSEP